MTEAEAEAFVRAFEAAWADRGGSSFAALWSAEGVLHAPHYGRPIFGREQAALTAFMRERQGKLQWRLVDWTHRGERVCILWETTNWIGDRELVWRGVDWVTVKDGKIVEEVVYYDTAPLRAIVAGAPAPAALLDF